MPTSLHVSRRLSALLLALALTACSTSEVAAPDGQVTVTGIVTEIVDQTPVDGGVTISIATSDETTERLLFGSLFTSPPPSAERLELYEQTRTARVGSRVRATGVRSTHGIALADFRVLIR